MGLLYHNHNFEFRSFEGQTAFDLLMKNTDPSVVRLEIDCYWMVAAGADPVRYLASPSRCSLLHIKDRKPGYKPTVEMNEGTAPFAVLGKGAIEYGRILTAAKRASVKLAYIDQDACDGDPMMCAEESRAAWSRVR
jgi:sugar phosphate isomerase/epimerase